MNGGVEIQDTTIVIAADIRPVGTQFVWLNLRSSFVFVKYNCLSSHGSSRFCRFVANRFINVKKIQFPT